jgi:hypothetical protein
VAILILLFFVLLFVYGPRLLGMALYAIWPFLVWCEWTTRAENVGKRRR